MSKFKTFIALAITVTLGLILRIYHNLDISLWHDEAFSALLIKYPWGEMFYRIGLDVHPPAYYVSLRFWAFFFGDSLEALRGFSIFFSTATIIAAYAFVKTAFHNRKAATIAALLIAVNPFHIQYATEARMYTFGAFVVVMAAYFLVKALQPARQQLTAYQHTAYYLIFGFLSGVAILTHYYLLFTVAAMCSYALMAVIKKQKIVGGEQLGRKNLIRDFYFLFSSYLVSFLMFLPWLSWFLYQYKQVGAGYWIPPMDKWSIPSTLYEMLIGTGVDIHKIETRIVLIILTLVIIAVTSHFLKRSASQHKWLVTMSWLAPFAGSLLFLLLSILKGSNSSVYLIRYFSFAVPFFSIMIAVWLSDSLFNATGLSLTKNRISQNLRSALTLLLIGINLAAFGRYWRDLKIFEKPGMDAAAKLLTNEARPNDHIIAGSSFEFFNLKYYLARGKATGEMFDKKKCRIDCLTFAPLARPLLFSGGNREAYNLPHFAGTAILTDADLLPSFEERTAPGDIIWLVWTNGFGGSKPQVPQNWIEISENGFAEVRPYVGTWVVVTKYQAVSISK